MINIKDLERLVEKVDIRDALPFIHEEEDKELFMKKDEHYRLLACLAMMVPVNLKPIYDIGTYKGLSALALACAISSRLVISYDIKYTVKIDRVDKIEFRIGDFNNDMDLRLSNLIMFDIDPHDGIQEREFVEEMKYSPFKGLVLFDDIHLNPEMEKFWNDISLPKYDLTHIGHWSGSGLVDFI